MAVVTRTALAATQSLQQTHFFACANVICLLFSFSEAHHFSVINQLELGVSSEVSSCVRY